MNAKTRLRDNKDMIVQVVYYGTVSGAFKKLHRYTVKYSDGNVDLHDIPTNNPEYYWLKDHCVAYEDIKEQLKQERLEEKQKRLEEKELRKAARTPVKTRILDGGTSSSNTHASGVGRAIVGGIVAGPVGAIVGAATAGSRTTQNNYTMFKIWYGDGHTSVEKVYHTDYHYKKYLELLDDGE